MSDVVFFFTCHLLGNRVSKTRFLTQKNLKKFEVSCIGRNTQKQIQEKNINPNPKDSDQREREIRGRERLRPRRPRRASPRLGSRAAWGSRSLGRPSARAPGRGNLGARAPGLVCAKPGSAWVAHSGLKPLTPISELNLFFFFFLWVFL